MTIREFWHDLRERFGDDHRSQRDWRYGNPRYERDWRPSWNRDRFDEPRGDLRGHSTAPYSSAPSSERFLRDVGGRTRGSYDPGVFTGNTWSADERSRNWTERNIDDYAQYAAGYTELGWPDRYSSTLYGVSYRGVGPQNWQRKDNRIREDICELMTEDDALDASDIEVSVQNGEVTLAGTVESRTDKRRAEDLAERVTGVRDVHNRLQVQRARDSFLGTRDALAGSSVGTTRPAAH